MNKVRTAVIPPPAIHPPAEKLWSAGELAHLIGVDPETCRRWLRCGDLKGVKVGRLWRITESDLLAFLRGRGFGGS